MANFYAQYPASSASSNPSIGVNGATAPASSTEVGGIGPDGNLHPISTDNSGVQNVNVVSSSLPTGSATAANQVLEIAQLTGIHSDTTAINGKTPGLGAAVTANSTPVNIASDQVVPTSSTQLPAALGQQPAANSLAVTLSNEDVQDMYMTGAAAQTTPVNNILPATASTAATDLTGYRSGTVQVVSSGTGGTFIFEGSNDNVSFAAVPVYNQVSVTGAPITTAITAAAGMVIYQLPINFRYLRLRIVTTITGGSIQAFSKFQQTAFAGMVTTVANNTAANLLATVSQATATNLNATVVQPTASSLNATVVQATAANLNATVTGTVVVSTTQTNNTTYTNADIASAAITTTTTGAAVTVAAGTSVAWNVAITAVSGTTPTYDFQVQESGDGVNYTVVYQAPRQTATGFFITPSIKLNHNRYRIVEIISGTTPSFTRAVTSSRTAGSNVYERNIIDRTIVPATTNSTTASLFVEGAPTYTMIVNQGAGGSAVTFAIDGSDDNVNWVTGLATVAGVVGGATPVAVSYSTNQFRYIRGRVVAGVASTTISYVTLAASNNSTAVGTLGQQNAANSQSVVIASGTSLPIAAASGRSLANAPTVTTYATPVTSAAYVQLIASTTSAANLVEIFDSSGVALYFAVGGSGSEVNQFVIYPGGNGQVPLAIPAGSRISIKAVSTSATGASAFNVLNLYS